MSVSEIYEWPAEKYPSYQYTKRKIRHVLRHDSERRSPRFVIANRNRAAGVPIQWAIRPGIEAQLRRLFSDPPPAEPQFPQSYDRASQLIQCVLCNRPYDRHKSVTRHQRETHPSHVAMSQSVNTSAAIYDPGAGSEHAAGEAQSSAITNTRRGGTWDRRLSEEEVTHQSSDDDLYYIDRLAEGRELGVEGKE
jgi:hypothetical protein